MNNCRIIFLLLLSLFIMASCSNDEQDPSSDIDIKTTFENTEFSGYFTLDGQTIPIDGAFIHVTKNSVFDEIIINLAPAGVSGSVAFPGNGWLQFRFNTAVENGFVTAMQTENNFTVSSSEALHPTIFQGLYIDGENKSWQIQSYGNVLENIIEYNSPEDYTFHFSFESDTFWQNEHGNNSFNNKQGDIYFYVSSYGNSGPSNSSNPLIGTWTYQQANCGTSKSVIQFTNDTNGSITIPDCNQTGTCPTGSVTGFNYTTSGSNITFDYTSFTVCGQSGTPPQGGTISYSVSGNKLTLGSQTWTKQ